MKKTTPYCQESNTGGIGWTIDTKLEAVVIPVSDVDCAKDFYLNLGWNLDSDVAADERYRMVQFTPPGSQCSVLFGKGVTDEPAGSVQGIHLIVSDIDAARAALAGRNVYVSDTFHDAGGFFHHAGRQARVSGLHPTRLSYGSFASFNDPDGNGWVMQEVTRRLPGRTDVTMTAFSSSGELAGALRRAARAHGEYEKTSGGGSENWAEWCAKFVIDEAGKLAPK
jgi:predicted enzyme related to lactoylglutathione lyase